VSHALILVVQMCAKRDLKYDRTSSMEINDGQPPTYNHTNHAFVTYEQHDCQNRLLPRDTCGITGAHKNYNTKQHTFSMCKPLNADAGKTALTPILLKTSATPLINKPSKGKPRIIASKETQERRTATNNANTRSLPNHDATIRFADCASHHFLIKFQTTQDIHHQQHQQGAHYIHSVLTHPVALGRASVYDQVSKRRMHVEPI